MTHNIAKIRAALESIRTCDDMLGEPDAALAALAELERAAAEPVAWMWNDMLGISHTYVSPKRPTWPDAGASPEMEMAINVRPLYAAPPAPVAEIREVGMFTAVEMKSAYMNGRLERAYPDPVEITWNASATRALIKDRAELGPSLGLVEIREPTDDECRNIWREAKVNEGDGSKVCAGRAMFDAVKGVLWPKEGL